MLVYIVYIIYIIVAGVVVNLRQRTGAQRDGQQGVQRRQHFFRIKGFGEVAVKAGRPQRRAAVGDGQRAGGEDGDGAGGGIALELLHHAVAVQLGQLQIADDQVGQRAARQRHDLFAVVGLQRLVAEGRQQVDHQLHVGLVVFDDQYARAHRASVDYRGRRGAALYLLL